MAGIFGARLGLSGPERRALMTGWPVGLAIVIMVMGLDILTRAHEQPGEGVGRAVVDEASSAIVTAPLLLLPFVLAIWIRRRAPPVWAATLAYLASAAIYPMLHVAGFVALRKAAYAAFLGCVYDFGPLASEFLYEAGKDVPAFAFASMIFWLILRRQAAASATAAARPHVFDIRDGARLVRAPLAQIMAVRSAGNYAEFVLEDGRRPLMRVSLSALQARLSPHGFVRTHRSWLVNPARVTGLKPEGSGDYSVELGAVEAPLSRRFPDALRALRA